MMINLTYIPYHDWRKILSEGNRTRDAHLIESFRSKNNIDKLIIVNRPITYAELFVKKRKSTRNLNEKLVFKKGNGRLYQLDQKTYLLDFFSCKSLSHIIQGRKWYLDAYGDEIFVQFYKECLIHLSISNCDIISSNIFSYRFLNLISGKKVIDAWDNFNLMPGLSGIKDQIFNAYLDLGNNITNWITNSEENAKYYSKHFNVKSIDIIKNGVNFNKFALNLEVPKDLQTIKNRGKKIAGFGGKITHLFDYDLFNHITSCAEDIDFIIVGQILSKEIFSKIELRENVFYLGDKHYEIYPNYIKNLDIGIVPYKLNEGQHGGDSIKVYEYLAAGLSVVGTRGNGLQNLEKYLNIADSKEEFCEFLSNTLVKEKINMQDFSWDKKADSFLKIIL